MRWQLGHRINLLVPLDLIVELGGTRIRHPWQVPIAYRTTASPPRRERIIS
jgi:hypothetical protein